ncbi:tetratricopeptide repeat protein [Micromonospora thermarum]|uniref:Tetratricopeptide repeat protein n=1 Tax=Micromonospora thermarum TaxID=2720024 RepID=A0ABX0Z248_9ACTN|nr:tetratricopeptide repeat protein [Micromonospora thermarum]NJP31064.1 tetratricopeptide repeat protein [Micromonospora thermarum]
MTAPSQDAGFSIIPPRRNRLPLRGRDQLVETILRAAEPPAGTSRVPEEAAQILWGLGGCGKSLTAQEVARQLEGRGRLVWWISAKDSARVSAGMREVAGQLQAPESQLDLAWAGKARSPVELVWDLLNDSARPWLLIFDNADEPSLLAPADGRVADGTGWFRQPRTPNGLVLVTTRDGRQETWGEWSTMHPVRELAPADGAQVLVDLAGTAPGTLAQARALAARLKGHPLALRGAGTYLAEANRIPVGAARSSIRTYDDYREALDRRAGAGTRRGGSSGFDTAVRPVVQSWEMSLDLLGGRGLDQARPMLRLLACLGDAPIPYSVLLDPVRLSASPLVGEIGEERLREVLRSLADFALVDLGVIESLPAQSPVSHVVTLHPLVRELVRDQPDVVADRAAYHELVLDLLDVLRLRDPDRPREEEFDPDEPDKWASWHVLAPPTMGAVLDFLDAGDLPRSRADLLDVALDLARLIARYILAVGLPGQAEIFLERCLAGCRRIGVDLDDRPVLSLRHERSRAALEQGHLAWAEEELRKIIPAREALLGREHRNTLASRHKLARTILEQGRWREAEEELRDIVRAEYRVRGPEDRDTMTARHSLARAIVYQGRYADARAELAEILEIRLRHWAPDHFETLTVRHTLDICRYEQGDVEAALADLREILATDTAKRQVQHFAMIAARHTLAHCLIATGAAAEAEKVLVGVVADRRRILGDDHAETARAEADLRKLREG